MELRQYIRIVLKNWWWIIPMVLGTITLTLVFSYSQTPIYGSSSTYVVGVGTDDPVYVTDVLASRQRIFVTNCAIMTSRTVLNEGLELLNVPVDIPIEKYEITCNVLPESNVLMLVVKGPSPTLVEQLNTAVGLAGLRRVNGENNPFPVESLDTVSVEEDPISPNHKTNLVLGAALGVIVSVALALLLEYFLRPDQEIEALSIRHAQLNVYKDSYFQRRLMQEIQRAHARNRPLCIAFLKVVTDEDFGLLPETTRMQLLRSAALQIQDYLREGDIVAYRGELIFEIMLPEISGHEASEVLEDLHHEVRSRTHNIGHHAANFSAVTVLVESSSDLNAHDMQEKGLKELAIAEGSGDHAVLLVSTSPKPFVDVTEFLQFGEGGSSRTPNGRGVDLSSSFAASDTQKLPPFSDIMGDALSEFNIDEDVDQNIIDVQPEAEEAPPAMTLEPFADEPPVSVETRPFAETLIPPAIDAQPQPLADEPPPVRKSKQVDAGRNPYDFDESDWDFEEFDESSNDE